MSFRPDHNLQDLRAKIFPLQRKKVKAPEIVSLPGRRKEISISSLVVSTPKVSEKAGTTGRRSKAAARKESRGSASLAERSVKNEGSFGDDTQNKSQIKKVITAMLYLTSFVHVYLLFWYTKKHSLSQISSYRKRKHSVTGFPFI